MTDAAGSASAPVAVSCPHCRKEITVRLDVSAVTPEFARAVAREFVLASKRGGRRL